MSVTLCCVRLDRGANFLARSPALSPEPTVPWGFPSKNG